MCIRDRPGTDRCFGDDLPQYLVDFDADAAGNVALVGRTYSAIDFGRGPISCGGPPGFTDGFLARFDGSGANTHASSHHGLRSVALRAGGLVLLTRDGFVSLDANSDPTGAFIPEMSPADAAPPFFLTRPDASGGIFAIGSIGGSWAVDFGGGPLSNSHPHQTSMLARVVLP